MSTEPLSSLEVEKMRIVGKLAHQTLDYITDHVKEGISTNKINDLAHEYILSLGATPAPLNYNGFPKSICTSLNHCICHGLPSDEDVLKNGDVLNIDVTLIKDGFFGDTSRMFFVGEVSKEAQKITEVAYEAMMRGIEAIRPYGTTGDIGFAIEKYVKRNSFFAVKDIGGHGIGRKFHTEPFVPSFGKKGKGDPLIPWTCLTVEPMINETNADIKEFDIKGSQVKYYETADKSLSAQFEHTILITDESYEILT